MAHEPSCSNLLTNTCEFKSTMQKPYSALYKFLGATPTTFLFKSTDQPIKSKTLPSTDLSKATALDPSRSLIAADAKSISFFSDVILVQPIKSSTNMSSPPSNLRRNTKRRERETGSKANGVPVQPNKPTM